MLTVMPEFGSGPFLRLNKTGDRHQGVGGNCCCYRCACGSHPMSEPLLAAFSEWILEFERAEWADYAGGHLALDWNRFHRRGLELARRLKAEVGPAFRVVYEKPFEDLAERTDERREVMEDGSIGALESRAQIFAVGLRRLVTTIVSGGQTGADRAALDWAMAHRYEHGGWCPKGRIAEDGVLSERYQMKETDSDGYRQRTKLNVLDSDGTLIVNFGEFDGGSLATFRLAERFGKPVLVVALDEGITEPTVQHILHWIRANPIAILNVAGPRESKRPGIYQLTWSLLTAVAGEEQAAGHPGRSPSSRQDQP
jgi:hypothetical protein